MSRPAPNLLLAIKLRLDRSNDVGQFLLTGSANLRRIPTVSDALRGRPDDSSVACSVAGEQTLPFGDGLWAVPLTALWQPGRG